MTADVGLFVAVELVEAMAIGTLFKSVVDVVGRDGLPGDMGGIEVTVNVNSFVVVSGGHNVVDSVGEGFDGTVNGFGALLVKGLTLGVVLLVGGADGCIDGFVQFMQWG